MKVVPNEQVLQQENAIHPALDSRLGPAAVAAVHGDVVGSLSFGQPTMDSIGIHPALAVRESKADKN